MKIKNKEQAFIDAAYWYAKSAHGDQVRKYTGEPYITHPVAVAELVATVTDDHRIISAALLHDVIEDTDRTYIDVKWAFGGVTANYVLGLTDVSKPSDGSRTVRKRMDLEHLKLGFYAVHTVKLADLIHNSKSIVEHDPEFAKIYMKEKEALIKVLIYGDKKLRVKAMEIIEKNGRFL